MKKGVWFVLVCGLSVILVVSCGEQEGDVDEKTKAPQEELSGAEPEIAPVDQKPEPPKPNEKPKEAPRQQEREEKRKAKEDKKA